MAKKKKRKHSGGVKASYAKYQFQGPKLTKAQKAYNEEVRKAARRIKSWEKKLGIKIEALPEVPKRATKSAMKTVQNITWAKMEKRLKEDVDIDRFIANFIRELSDVDSHLTYPAWMSNWLRWMKRERALRYRDKMLAEIQQFRSSRGEKALYARLKTPEVAQDLLRTAYSLYDVDSDNAEETAATGYFNEFKAILTGEILNDQELRGMAEFTDGETGFMDNANY